MKPNRIPSIRSYFQFLNGAVSLVLTLATLAIPGYSQSVQKNVTIYETNFTAKDFGQKKFEMESDQMSLIPAILNRYNPDEYLNDLGTYRSSQNAFDKSDLFNLSTQDILHAVLDSINITFYVQVGIDKLIGGNQTILEEDLFIELKKSLSNKGRSIQAKKEFLQLPKYSDYRSALIKSRYEIEIDSFHLAKNKAKKATEELLSYIDKIDLHSVKKKSEVRSYLRSVADESIMLIGTTYQARLDPRYEALIIKTLTSTCIDNKVITKESPFISSLIDFAQSDSAAINTGLIAIGLTGKIFKVPLNQNSIASELKTRFNISAEVAENIATRFDDVFSSSIDEKFSKDFDHVYVLRYFTSKMLNDLSIAECLMSRPYCPKE